MYVDFKRLVKQQEPIDIPQEIIRQLNKELPKGLEYVQIGENACGVTSKEDLNIKLNIVFPEIPNKFSELIKTSEDFFEYMYRTQTKLSCKPNEDGTITINNHKISCSDFIKFPLSDKKLKEFGEFSIEPQEFPEMGTIVFQTGKMKKSLKLKRVPYESMDTIAIETSDNTWLKVRILLHEKTFSANINFIFRLEIIKSVNEIVQAYKYHNSLFTNGVSMAGFNINGKISKDKIISNKTIDFWEKVLQLENKLGLHFDCSTPLTRNVAYEFHILFRCFIEDKPYREDIKVKSDTGLYFSEIGEIEKQIGQEIAVSYIQEISWEIQSQIFSSYTVTSLFNTIVDSIDEIDSLDESNKYFVKLRSAENKTMFQVMKLFMTRDEAENFQSEMNKNYSYFANKMREAEKIII
ncbi:hypothetical protein BHF68_04945 [Desulfuribacillus alkaliarsenatis]|uniref:Uncharacterized protein n=2 Tax=Desulfuribacillus alkaliarsenatis TaxID=766136 RepID=A0A1E5G3A1_9FIRM|nr:hypothetical protein BHF68_04945 [Desulfuribacillus alkaliarsenatis]